VDDYSRFRTLRVERRRSRLYVHLNRPEVKNALNEDMIEELSRLAQEIAPDRSIRTLILRGADRTFCAGADIRGFRKTLEAPPPAAGEVDPIAANNRRFGDCLLRLQRLPATTVGVVEGAAFGGGLGLTCVLDVVICARNAKFALSETGLGIPPAQIAPFVVQRLGLTTARRLALTGARFDGATALEIGLADFVAKDAEELDAILTRVLNDIGRCAPGANAATKQILLESSFRPIEDLLDDASDAFAAQLRGEEGREGIAAFLEKRAAAWVDQVE
jgi:isohexenylglutaconyl-CoA hydratase